MSVKTSMDLVEFMSRMNICNTSDVFQTTVSKDNFDDRKSYECHHKSTNRRRRSIDRRYESTDRHRRRIDRSCRSTESRHRSTNRRHRSTESRHRSTDRRQRSIDRRCRSIERRWERIDHLSRTIYHRLRMLRHPYSKNADCHQRIRINHHRRSVGDNWNSHHSPLKNINGYNKKMYRRRRANVTNRE